MSNQTLKMWTFAFASFKERVKDLFYAAPAPIFGQKSLSLDIPAIEEDKPYLSNVIQTKKTLKGWVTTGIDVMTRCMVEYIACGIFHFIGSVSPTPWANGIVLMVLVYYTAKISGGHLNPAVSATFMLLGHTDPMEMVVYWGAQVAGCATGALLVAGIVPGLMVRGAPSGPYASLSGCFTPQADLTDFQIFAWEAACTTFFIVPIFSVVWYTQNKKGYGNTGPLIVGFSLLANALACGAFTGASLNPARTLGSPIVFACPSESKAYLYVLGEFTGSVCALFAIVPWYGISRTAWYAGSLPEWAYQAAKNNEKCIVLETVKYGDETPSRTIGLNGINGRNMHLMSPRYSMDSSNKARAIDASGQSERSSQD